jgi:hypothetical protein
LDLLKNFREVVEGQRQHDVSSRRILAGYRKSLAALKRRKQVWAYLCFRVTTLLVTRLQRDGLRLTLVDLEIKPCGKIEPSRRNAVYANWVLCRL